MTGAAGDDTMTGGAGSDTFVFRRNTDEDETTDFQNGKDRIDLSAFDVSGGNKLKNSDALISDGSGGTILVLNVIDGNRTLYIDDMSIGQWNGSDFIF